MNGFAACHDNNPRVHRLTDPLVTIANCVAMVFALFIDRIAIAGNIGIFRRIQRIATIAPFLPDCGNPGKK
jgi:hypothetical protein